ncbi:MAG: DUF3375 domain-containing protein [Spirochaetales bacterium]|nr:DUF3375 domain-containing protein [Spirochaetales bacterium]
MAFDYYDLMNKKKNNSSWRLMTADNGPLIISFLDHVFRMENLRQIDEDELKMKLEDFLFHLRDGRDDDPFPRSAGEYLEDWTAPGKDWLRKFYPPGSDSAHYDLTPGTERVFQWVDDLVGSGFIGTESRLNTCFDLLSQIVRGVEEDRELRIAELKERKRLIDREIRDIQNGHIPMMDERQVRERFLQFSRTARELLSDFRAVEHNFRELDRDIRLEIASWEGEKGELLEQFFGSHDRISHSDEGQSFTAFWDFIMSPSSQEELTRQLDRVYELESLGELLEDRRLKRIHYDWMAAGEQTQRTVARLSKQLRRYLDDRAFWENRRITEILDSIEKKAVQLKDNPPAGEFAEAEEHRIRVSLPMEHPLFVPAQGIELVSAIERSDNEEIDTDKLFNLVYIDRERLEGNIEASLQGESQIRLIHILEKHPLEQGLAELITYLHMAEEDSRALVQAGEQDSIRWNDGENIVREARFPRIIYSIRSSDGAD